MPDQGIGLPRQAMREKVLAELAELARGGLVERMRLEAAARLLVTARRALILLRAGQLPAAAPAEGMAALVAGLAEGWDPAATTAAEYVEALSPAQLDALLAAAPAWAAALSTTPDRRASARRAA